MWELVSLLVFFTHKIVIIATISKCYTVCVGFYNVCIALHTLKSTILKKGIFIIWFKSKVKTLSLASHGCLVGYTRHLVEKKTSTLA